MITIEKTYGVKGVANDATMLRLQELIFLAKKQYGLVGKAVIDTEKITYSKFGLKLGGSSQILVHNAQLQNSLRKFYIKC